MKPVRRKYFEIDPAKHFEKWAITPPHHLWPAIGITRHPFIDEEKTNAARAKALLNGTLAKDVKRINIRYLAWAKSDPANYDHQEGDLFSLPDGSHLQTVAFMSAFEIECHLIPFGATAAERTAYILRFNQLADWLKTGSKPDEVKQIVRGQSKTDVLKYYIAQ